MGVDVKEVIAYLMENGEVERIRNSLDLSDMVDIELFERSSYAYKESLH